jgi:hypothetical protein
MTQHEEELMHRAKVVTLMSAEEITAFTEHHRISIESLTKFFLKMCRLPREKECDFIANYGFDKWSTLCDTFKNMPSLEEIMEPILRAQGNTGKMIIVKKSSAMRPTSSQNPPYDVIDLQKIFNDTKLGKPFNKTSDSGAQ